MMAYQIKRKCSFGHDIRGCKMALHEEPHMRIHVVAFAIVLLLAFALKIEMFSLFVLPLCYGLVCVVEMINSALEATFDALCTDHNPYIGKAKDMAAGAVLVAALNAVTIGLIIFGNRIGEVL